MTQSNQKPIYLVYSTDNWHSYDSRDLLAVCTTFSKCITMIKKAAKRQNTPLNDEDLYLLNTINQTQGYGGYGEFVIDTQLKNTLL